MDNLTFGEFLHKIRKRQNGSELARKSNISYVYLLDIEKGARAVPSKDVLLSLSENLQFFEDEKELFFDIAAREKEEIPVDIESFLLSDDRIVKMLRSLKKSADSNSILDKILLYFDKENK